MKTLHQLPKDLRCALLAHIKDGAPLRPNYRREFLTIFSQKGDDELAVDAINAGRRQVVGVAKPDEGPYIPLAASGEDILWALGLTPRPSAVGTGGRVVPMSEEAADRP